MPFAEAMAVELGSDMLSEMFIFAIGATILVYEYNRSAESAERKENELQVDAFVSHLSARIRTLFRTAS